ncbi:MAG: transglycosylase domain-containing protein [Verrucomicrobiales bacterium]
MSSSSDQDPPSLPDDPSAENSDLVEALTKDRIPARKKRRNPLLAFLFKLTLVVLLLIAVAGSVAGILVWRQVSHYFSLADEFDLTELPEMPTRSVVFDRHGVEIGRLHGENRVPIELDQVSQNFIDALLAREDARFYEHQGVDVFGVIRATWVNVQAGEVLQGASTISQQLARNAFPLGGRNMERKFLEAAVAFRIEQKFSKEEILEFYMNRIYLGSGFYGVEAAAQGYFGKSASELSIGESAMIVGIIRSPSRFSPYVNKEAAVSERNQALDRMQAEGMLTRQEAESLKAEPLHVVGPSRAAPRETYMMDAVRRELDLVLDDEYRGYGGLQIHTSLDTRLQEAAQEALDNRLTEIESQPGWRHPRRTDFTIEETEEEKPTAYLQGALVVIDNRTGGIRVLVGGRDYRESKLNRALSAFRQVGSTFKPFIYAAAYQYGLLPDSPISDGRIQPGEVENVHGVWSPGNADGKYGGYSPASQGLIRSRNTMSIRVGERAGLERVIATAIQCGVVDSLPFMPSIYLGAFESTVRNLTRAMTVFPNNGVLKQSYLVERIDDSRGQPLLRVPGIQVNAIPAGAAWFVNRNLQTVMTSGTAGRSSSLGWTKPSGGKTGTTNEFRDAWFVGYTSSLTCGVWVGMDQPTTIMSRGFGSTLALPIWVDVMLAAPDDLYPAESMEAVPVEYVEVRRCAVSGLLPVGGCRVVTQMVPADLVPEEECEGGHALQPFMLDGFVLDDQPEAIEMNGSGESFFPSEAPEAQPFVPDAEVLDSFAD